MACLSGTGAFLGDLLLIVLELVAELLAAARRMPGLLALLLGRLPAGAAAAVARRPAPRRRGSAAAAAGAASPLGVLALGCAVSSASLPAGLLGGRRRVLRRFGGLVGLFLGHDRADSRVEYSPSSRDPQRERREAALALRVAAKRELSVRYPSTARPMLRAVPSMMRTA